MPLLTRMFLKTSFIYLGLALAVGVLLAAQSLWHLPAVISGSYPAYFHLFTVGWLTLLIFGVAYWMFPKFTLAQPHGNEALAWAAYPLLNIGLILRLVSEPINAQTPQPLWGWLLLLSAVFQWLGAMAIMATLWCRVKVK